MVFEIVRIARQDFSFGIKEVGADEILEVFQTQEEAKDRIEVLEEEEKDVKKV